jgi:flagellar export protein FliJ
MRKFAFPLSRVLDWRRTQTGLEEMKLSQLHAELRDIENRIACARAERADSERDLIESGAMTGASLAALDSFKKCVAAECAGLEELAVKCRRRIAHQIEIVRAKRRDASLLEKLERKKRTEWNAEFARESDRLAEEAHTSRRYRNVSGSPARASQI